MAHRTHVSCRLFFPQAPSYSLLRPVWSILAFPLHVLSSVFRFIFGVLRIPFPQFRFTSLNFYRPLRPRTSARGGPDRWLRELEEETGAISISRSNLPRGTTTSVTADPGQSSLTARSSSTVAPTEDGRKLLPDFTICSYEEMLRTCQREAKIGCVILVSEEHDDVPAFKR
jgi:FAS-associated factor 2